MQEHAGAGRYERIRDELQRWSPSELVLGRREAESEEYRELLSSLDNVTMSVHEGGKEQHLQVVKDHLDLVDLGSVDLDRRPLAMEACGLAAGYLTKLHLVDVVPLREVHFDSDDGHLVLDQTTLPVSYTHLRAHET